MRLGSCLLAGRPTGLTPLLISSRRTLDSENVKWLLKELKDMSSGQIVGALCHPIIEQEELRALANSSHEPQNVDHLHMPIRGGERPLGPDPCRFIQRSNSSSSLASPIPSKLDDAAPAPWAKSIKGPTDAVVLGACWTPSRLFPALWPVLPVWLTSGTWLTWGSDTRAVGGHQQYRWLRVGTAPRETHGLDDWKRPMHSINAPTGHG